MRNKAITKRVIINEEKKTVVTILEINGAKFVGKAKCNVDAGDVFDPEVGKRISYLRAKIKLEKTIYKMQNKYLNYVENLLKKNYDYIFKTSKKIADAENELKKLTV